MALAAHAGRPMIVLVLAVVLMVWTAYMVAVVVWTLLPRREA